MLVQFLCACVHDCYRVVREGDCVCSEGVAEDVERGMGGVCTWAETEFAWGAEGERNDCGVRSEVFSLNIRRRKSRC